MEDQLSLPLLQLTVEAGTLPLFTTVLQSGIEIKTPYGTTLGQFLHTFPGFTADYLADTVQTIFLNGTAVDNLTLPLTGSHPVLALSAAMPGLAGAIFRRNSFHAALRTDTKALESQEERQDFLPVTLKLFNSIAKERGEELLRSGVCMRAELFAAFLGKRPNLAGHIRRIRFDKKELAGAELLPVLAASNKINLSIVGANG